MRNVLIWSIAVLVLIALVFYIVSVESDAELDPLRQEGGLRGLWKSFKRGLHHPPAPEPIETDLTGFLASNTEAGPAYVEADRVAARITHHTKTGYQMVRNTVDPMGGALSTRPEVRIGDNPLALYPPPAFIETELANRPRPVVVDEIPSEPVRPLPGDEFGKPKFKVPKRPIKIKPTAGEEPAAAAPGLVVAGGAAIDAGIAQSVEALTLDDAPVATDEFASVEFGAGSQDGDGLAADPDTDSVPLVAAIVASDADSDADE